VRHIIGPLEADRRLAQQTHRSQQTFGQPGGAAAQGRGLIFHPALTLRARYLGRGRVFFLTGRRSRPAAIALCSVVANTPNCALTAGTAKP
jgi:hypothetical protein